MTSHMIKTSSPTVTIKKASTLKRKAENLSLLAIPNKNLNIKTATPTPIPKQLLEAYNLIKPKNSTKVCAVTKPIVSQPTIINITSCQ